MFLSTRQKEILEAQKLRVRAGMLPSIRLDVYPRALSTQQTPLSSKTSWKPSKS